MPWYLFLLMLAFPWALACAEGSKDAKRADRWNHLMKETFHMKWGYLRGWLLLLLSFLAWQPDWWLFWFCTAYQLCAFGYGFTAILNTKRKKAMFYQSREPRAANTDKAFVALSGKIGLKPEELAMSVYSLLLLGSFLFFVYSMVSSLF